MSVAMRYRQLGRTGMRLSIVSLGGSGYGNVYGDLDESEAQKSLKLVENVEVCHTLMLLLSPPPPPPPPPLQLCYI